MQQKFITNCDRSLLQNSSGFFLQNATAGTKCDNFITKCSSYYKMPRLLQIASGQITICRCIFKAISSLDFSIDTANVIDHLLLTFLLKLLISSCP